MTIGQSIDAIFAAAKAQSLLVKSIQFDQDSLTVNFDLGPPASYIHLNHKFNLAELKVCSPDIIAAQIESAVIRAAKALRGEKI